MAVIKPPITGDLVLDSWLNQITQALNTGVAGTSAGGTSQVKSGASGFNTATIYLYARTSSDSAPSAMNEETTYTYKTSVLVNGSSHDGVSNGLGPNDAWFRNVPSGAGGYIWVTTVHVADTGAVETIGSSSWSAVTKLAEKGEQGKFAVELYKRSSSAPSAPTDVTWTYATSALSGNNSASWALAVPSGTDQVWISSTIFDPSTAATNITSWGTPFQGGTTGPAGAAGTNNATVAIYQKNTNASSAPSNPSGTFTYTFSTGVLSAGTFNSWSQTLPTLAKGEYLWMKHATASSTSNTDSIPASEFSTAAITSAAGIDGSSVSVVELFKVSTSNSSAPADPSGTFTYTFATDALSGGTLNGWSQSAPNVPAGQYLWVIQASAVSNTATDTIAASEFSGAVVISGVGATGATGNTGSTGAAGIRQTVGRVYRTATDANAPTAPTNSNSVYSFSSNAFTTLPIGCSETPPTPNTSDSNPYWQCTFSAVEDSAGGSVTETFGSPIKVIEFDGIVKFTNSNTLSDGSTSIVPPKVFRQTGTPTAISAGDLWIDTDDNNKLYAASGTGTSNWVLSQDASAANALAVAAQNTANSKTATFRQNGVPTSLAVGDLWVDTDDGNKMYVATSVGADQVTSGECVTVQDAAIAAAQTSADSKAKVFRQDGTPTATAAGDIWIDTNDNNEMYIASGSGTGNWVREDFVNLINNNTTTIDGGKITAASIQAAQIDANAITAAKLDANAITGKNILIGDLAVNTSTGAVTGGEGFKAIGTGTGAGIVSMGDATTNITVHPSSGLLTLNGNIVGTANINSQAVTRSAQVELSSAEEYSQAEETVLTLTMANSTNPSTFMGSFVVYFQTGSQAAQGAPANTTNLKVKLNGTVIDSIDQTHVGSSSALQSWVWRGNIFEANTSTGNNIFTLTVGAANSFGGGGDTTPEVQVGTNLVVQEFKR